VKIVYHIIFSTLQSVTPNYERTMTSWFYMHETVTNAQQMRFFRANLLALGEIMLDFYFQEILKENFFSKQGQLSLRGTATAGKN